MNPRPDIDWPPSPGGVVLILIALAITALIALIF